MFENSIFTKGNLSWTFQYFRSNTYNYVFFKITWPNSLLKSELCLCRRILFIYLTILRESETIMRFPRRWQFYRNLAGDNLSISRPLFLVLKINLRDIFLNDFSASFRKVLLWLLHVTQIWDFVWWESVHNVLYHAILPYLGPPCFAEFCI